jgi:indole-3-glycerol phosphate synthase
MSILKEIIDNTKKKLAAKKELLSLKDLITKIDLSKIPVNSFKSSLANKDQAIIAEIKKASPSAGIIKEDFNPVEIAKSYEAFGASALSVLTEEDYFLGSPQFLIDVKANSKLPILRKDFMIDEYQIYEAKLMGADCILLIVSVLEDQQISKFVHLAESLQLDYLIEVHNEEELNRVKAYKNAIIGVNNRNLKNFEVSLENSIKLKKIFSGENIFVAESGIKSQSDIDYLKENGINVFLIGESLMRGNLT